MATPALLVLLLGACRVEFGPPTSRADSTTHEVWVYSSMYQEVLDAMAPDLAAALPDVRVQFFQAGSEKVSQRWEAEHAAGGSRACVLATSDPAWYEDLAGRGLLRTHVPGRALDLPRAWAHPTHAAFRVSLMVLAGVGDAPARFEDLRDPRWAGRFSSPDPLASGTMFTALAALDAALGADWTAAARANGWVAAGGNAAVVARMQSGENPVGIVLLENLLAQEGYAAQRPGLARPVLSAGAIPVPGYAAIPTDCPNPAAAERVMDWFFSPTAAAHLRAGRMHGPFAESPLPDGAPPPDALPWMELPADFAARTATRAPELRARWSGRGG
jgi:iron(III) transport system substrate-binding protein